MSILLVGCGYWGRNWARTLSEMEELGAICEPVNENAERIREKYPHIAIYTSLSDALRHPDLEAVVVATPAVSHYELARQCLEQGKAVLAEKPLTLQTEEAAELNALATQKGLVLAVGHLLTYHPALRKLQALMCEGALGDILGIECTRINLGKVRNEENAWWSLAPHDLSIVDMLLDEPMQAVSACKRNLLRRPAIEDEVYAHFISRSGVSASIRVSWLSPVKRHETVVIGSRKIAVFEDTLPDGQELKLFDYRFEQTGEQFGGIQAGEAELVQYESAGNLLERQAVAFLAAVRGSGQPLLNNGQSGERVTRLLSEVQEILLRQATVFPVPV